MVGVFAQESVDDAIGVGLAVLFAALAIALVVLWIAAVVSVLRNRRLTGGGKVLWILVIFGFPFLGSLGWFVFGRDARLVKDAV